jgi:hypothetical protein
MADGVGPAGAGGGFLFSEFLKGYHQGTVQQSALKMQKASGLMQMAIEQQKAAEGMQNADLAAFARQHAQEYMDEAHKLMTQKSGAWNLIKGLIGGKKGGSGGPQPLSGLGAQGTTMSPETAPTTQTQTPESQLPRPKGTVSESELPQQRPMNVPVSGDMGITIPEPPSQETHLPVPEQAPSALPTLARASNITVSGAYEKPLPPGVIKQNTMVGKGLERVQTSGGNIQTYLEGMPVSDQHAQDFNTYSAQLQLQKGLNKDQADYQAALTLKTEGARLDLEDKHRNERVDALIKTPAMLDIKTKNPLLYDRIEAQLRAGVALPNQAPVMTKIEHRDPETHHRILEQQDVMTGNVYSSIEQPFNTREGQIEDVFNEMKKTKPDATWSQAEAEVGRRNIEKADTVLARTKQSIAASKELVNIRRANQKLRDTAAAEKAKGKGITPPTARMYLEGAKKEAAQMALSEQLDPATPEYRKRVEELIPSIITNSKTGLDISWDDFQKTLRGGIPAVTPQVKANATISNIIEDKEKTKKTTPPPISGAFKQ